ncbi:ATP-binding protein [Psychrobium sp. 1_MG-2023]|uniref:ATP-binding protein n=1 Tax=Psychrobium sp. 1_MG-2023 TaxID=3062624 RepID=UPI000C328EB8|nr:ATP-binding protein [Psychrobium sp. 1_MG-2023]MDP2560654.1 ATP-binding protein [Psychrobium sp. 1_MG-2023]PKF56550.1 ATP-binding protein [Alteromonadales bacterium alter-6D02]
MASLRRIILIHTHLPGVVELSLDGHTNICGTNASGKTTLQRLVPVFFGELPSKVVPKTRSKFGDFYLPQSNSYLVYEYQREEGQVCQAVLTHSPKDGVQYRFVDGPYDKSQLLYQDRDGKVNAFEPDQWLAQLKVQQIDRSPKLNATSEFRSIIQNDVSTLRGNTKDGIKLRQLAARYSLVAPRHKIRHLEKLVSAVHAKEGKMDTLKTMLAAIFEEDGLVQPTTRVKNTKAREWIKQIRQSMRLSTLETQHGDIEQIANKLNVVEGQLVQLTPLLVDDLGLSRTQHADLDQQEKTLRKQVSVLKGEFNQREAELNSQLSQIKAELQTTEQRLDFIQGRYDDYIDSDMEQLASDATALPLWIEQLSEQQNHYRILLEQYGDLEQQLNQQKISLTDSLERLLLKNQKQIRAIEGEREHTRQLQSDKRDSLQEQYNERKEQLASEFDHQISEFRHQQIERQTQIDNMGPTQQEQEELALADKRLDLVQDKWRELNQLANKEQRAHQQAREQQQHTQNDLEQARTVVHQLSKKLRLLEQQISPEQGSLRHYLRAHVEGWENTVGKVINEELLERSDLQPQLGDAQGADLFGVKVSLADIAAPHYAQDEAALSIEKEQLCLRLSSAQEQQGAAEAALTSQHQVVKSLLEQHQQATQRVAEIVTEVDFAKESKARLQQAMQASLTKRREEASVGLKEAKTQIERLNQTKLQNLTQLKSDHQQQMLEFKADWQQEIEYFSQQIGELEAQIDSKRQSNKTQIKQLEDAFKRELADKDIDPATLEQLKTEIKRLEKKISEVRSRQDELREYRHFMEVEWQKNRPRYLEQEASLKSQRQQSEAQLAQQKAQFKVEQQQLESQRDELQSQMHSLTKLIERLMLVVARLTQLVLDNSLADGLSAINGDQSERLSRAIQGLEQRSKTQTSLKEQLNQFEAQLALDAQKQFLDLMTSELSRLDQEADLRQRLPIFSDLLRILADQQRQILEQGETIGGDLHKFFTVFSDINRRISGQSKRLTAAVADDLTLDGIKRSEVRIISTVDELNFWSPLKRFAALYEQWRETGKELPSDEYIDALADVVELLRADSSYSIESLLRLELHLNEGGNDLVIKNDRQLLESSSHGMAYLILCKFLLAFTRLLRGEANIAVHWPIDEIGTLAYHNVEKLFNACDSNNISIVGAFPNPESDVLTLFKHRYLIDKQKKRLQRIEPKTNRIEARLTQQLNAVQGVTNITKELS